jgi:DNA-binding response OmpR family regulator
VDYACDGLDGYRLAAENSYDVVVLDLMPPHLDGIEVCRLRRGAQVRAVLTAATRWTTSSPGWVRRR